MMDNKLAVQIREKMKQKPTDELLSIWTKNDRNEWTKEAFEAISDVLAERNVSIPEQLPCPSVIQKQGIDEANRGNGMQNIILDENEHFIAFLISNTPEQLYKHKNQVAAITNKRLLFIRYTGLSRSFENSYKVVSKDIRDVLRVKQRTDCRPRCDIYTAYCYPCRYYFNIWLKAEGFDI